MTYRRALVTGGGRRLGREMALALGKRGLDVAVHYNSSAEAAEEVAGEVREMGRTAAALRADLLDEDAVRGLVPAAAEALGGPIDCLINNASIFEHDGIGSLTRESWDRAMETNLRAPVVLTEAMAEALGGAGEDENGEPLSVGIVVNMIDQRVRKLTPGFMSYTVAKMGLWAFTRTAAQALGPKVRVNAIGPGPTLLGDDQDPAKFDRQRRHTVLERGSLPDDIVAAMQYLLDARAVTGQLICVDGGQHLAWRTPDVSGAE